MKIIDIEAHFLTEGYVKFVKSRQSTKSMNPVEAALRELGDTRLRNMDAAGVTMQVLSASMTRPKLHDFEPKEAAAWARSINDELAGVIAKRPDRFAGLATLAPQGPDEAAAELQRCVANLGFKGASIPSHVRGEYFDNRKYWPIFQMAQTLDVPICLHPAAPPAYVQKWFEPYGHALFGAALGFGFEASLHAMRMIYGGLFDEYPYLKIVLGHMGEALPFWLSRIDFSFDKNEERPAIKRKPSEYIKSNFTITTSGMFYEPALVCSLMSLGSDNIAFAVDYPYEDNRPAVAFLKNASISDPDRERIFHKTAERLFKL